MHSAVLLVAALAASAFASPIDRREPGPGCGIGAPPHPDPPSYHLAGLTPPLDGDGADLPAPPSNLTLKYIALGFGIQNYTCASPGAVADPTGALAMLYDASELYPGVSRWSISESEFYDLPATLVEHYKVPLNFNSSTAGLVDPSSLGASTTDPFTAPVPLKMEGLPPLSWLGHHFFDLNGVPNFVLPNVGVDMLGAKTDSVAAPTTSDAGPEGTGAVAWLYLTALPGSKGAQVVYRVLTAGGNPQTCSVAGSDSVSYSATYWFFE